MSRTVLVADDSKTIRQIVEMALKASSWEVVGVGSAQEAVQAARQHPSVILLDYYMPDGSGYDVCRALKGDTGTNDIPIVMLGGTYKNFDEGLARQAGADAVLMKPFKTDALIDALENAQNGAVAAPEPEPEPKRAPVPKPDYGYGGYGDSSVGEEESSEPVYEPPDLQPEPAYEAPTPSYQRDRTDSASGQPRIPSQPARTGSSPDINASSREAAAPTPTPSPTPAAAGAGGVSRAEIEALVKEEVKAAVRSELPALLRSVMGEIFQQKVLPKLMEHAEQRVKTVVNENLVSQIQGQVRIELERLLSEE